MISKLLWPSIFVCTIIYFIFHIFNGERGIFALKKMNIDFANANEELKTLEEQEKKLKNSVYLLRPDTLDLDMLEEQIKRILNMTNDNEITFTEN